MEIFAELTFDGSCTWGIFAYIGIWYALVLSPVLVFIRRVFSNEWFRYSRVPTEIDARSRTRSFSRYVKMNYKRNATTTYLHMNVVFAMRTLYTKDIGIVVLCHIYIHEFLWPRTPSFCRYSYSRVYWLMVWAVSTKKARYISVFECGFFLIWIKKNFWRVHQKLPL